MRNEPCAPEIWSFCKKVRRYAESHSLSLSDRELWAYFVTLTGRPVETLKKMFSMEAEAVKRCERLHLAEYARCRRQNYLEFYSKGCRRSGGGREDIFKPIKKTSSCGLRTSGA